MKVIINIIMKCMALENMITMETARHNILLLNNDWLKGVSNFRVLTPDIFIFRAFGTPNIGFDKCVMRHTCNMVHTYH